MLKTKITEPAMSNFEMILRYGFYAGTVSRYLGDQTYALRYLGRAEMLTPEAYACDVPEMRERLIAAGVVAADEDPFERAIGGRLPYAQDQDH